MRNVISKFKMPSLKKMNDIEIADAVFTATNNLDEAEKREIVHKKFLPKARKVASKLPFVRDLFAGYNCMLDNETPRPIKAAIVIPLAYFVIPLDAIPDLIPAAGYTDDLGVWLASMKIFGSYINETHYHKADATLNDHTE